MIKKLSSLLLTASIILSPVSSYAASFGGGHSTVSQSNSGSSYSSHSTSSHSKQYHSGSSFSGGSSINSSSSTYHSGYRSPSTNVRNHSYNQHNQYQAPAPKKTNGILTHAAAFGAGALLGSMFHPFGGTYSAGVGFGAQHHGLSFMGLVIDLVIILIIVAVARRLLFR